MNQLRSPQGGPWQRAAFCPHFCGFVHAVFIPGPSHGGAQQFIIM